MSGRSGQIISFYSYKGGVGRSMALANVATLLAQRNKRVLAIDLDLEAPGLHRYFLSARREVVPPSKEEGAIEFFTAMREQIELQSIPPREAITALLEESRFRYTVTLNNPNLRAGAEASPADPNRGRPKVELSFMAAGRFDTEYPQRVHAFDWQSFYERTPEVFAVLADELRSRYDYVLVDARTGITDVGSVCTVLLPDKLVLAFSPNEQSLHGVEELALQASQQRDTIAPGRPLHLFPLAGRLENAEKERQQRWLAQAKARFERVARKIAKRKDINLGPYFEDVRIHHSSYYAYGEEIAAEQEPQHTVGSMAAAFARLVDNLQGEGITGDGSSTHTTPPPSRTETQTAEQARQVQAALTTDRAAIPALFDEYLSRVDSAVAAIRIDPDQLDPLDEQVLAKLALLTPYRDEFVGVLDALCRSPLEDCVLVAPLIRFLENILRLREPQLRGDQIYRNKLWADHHKFFMHELFIYITCTLIRARRFRLCHELTAAMYFSDSDGHQGFFSFTRFRAHVESLEEQRNKRLFQGRRVSVTRDVMHERATLAVVPFEDLMQADFVLFLSSIVFGTGSSLWFPVTNMSEPERPFRLFAQAEAKRYFVELKELFGVASGSELRSRLQSAFEKDGRIPKGQLRLSSFIVLDVPLLSNLEKLDTL